MSDTERSAALKLLRRATGRPDAEFRPGQWEAIHALVNERARLLVVQRTGWGKSSVYFIATRILRDRGMGPTLIVSPLLALMRDQIKGAERLGIRALTINSTNPTEWPGYHETMRRNEADALLISPERLANDEFVQRVLMSITGDLGMLVVDEAHCISDWGHDFRPDYRRLKHILQRTPRGLPVLGTTATANERVMRDVQSQLGSVQVKRGPLERQTLRLATLRLESQAARLAWLAEHVSSLPGTGIIYVLTKRDATLVSSWLRAGGVDAAPYFSDVRHANFKDSHSYRLHLESRLYNNRLKALVATPALGMGYDKPDLGFVVHYQAPGSIVAYYQQVGRAGRAIDEAYGVLMAGAEDEDIHQHFRRTAFPAEEHVQTLLDALSRHDQLSVRELEAAFNLRRGQIEHVLKYLSVENPAPVIKQGAKWARTPAPYALDRDRIRRLTQRREREWLELEEYIDSRGCLMRRLTAALDDPLSEDCGRCSNCVGRSVIPECVGAETIRRAMRYIRASEFPLKCKKQVASGAFAEYGFRGALPPELRAETGRVLSRWGDAGWGHVVARDKHDGRFSDALVDAMAEMIRLRWRPSPAPEWVTSVPSLTHPRLVPDFAERLARAMGAPHIEAVRKVKRNQPQKMQQNRYHQCVNLDGVFGVAGAAPSSPVLLVDDIVDSRWTMTVVAALLRRAGAGPVFPVALASAGGDE